MITFKCNHDYNCDYISLETLECTSRSKIFVLSLYCIWYIG